MFSILLVIAGFWSFIAWYITKFVRSPLNEPVHLHDNEEEQSISCDWNKPDEKSKPEEDLSSKNEVVQESILNDNSLDDVSSSDVEKSPEIVNSKTLGISYRVRRSYDSQEEALDSPKSLVSSSCSSPRRLVESFEDIPSQTESFEKTFLRSYEDQDSIYATFNKSFVSSTSSKSFDTDDPSFSYSNRLLDTGECKNSREDLIVCNASPYDLEKHKLLSKNTIDSKDGSVDSSDASAALKDSRNSRECSEDLKDIVGDSEDIKGSNDGSVGLKDTGNDYHDSKDGQDFKDSFDKLEVYKKCLNNLEIKYVSKEELSDPNKILEDDVVDQEKNIENIEFFDYGPSFADSFAENESTIDSDEEDSVIKGRCVVSFKVESLTSENLCPITFKKGTLAFKNEDLVVDETLKNEDKLTEEKVVQEIKKSFPVEKTEKTSTCLVPERSSEFSSFESECCSSTTTEDEGDPNECKDPSRRNKLFRKRRRIISQLKDRNMDDILQVYFLDENSTEDFTFAIPETSDEKLILPSVYPVGQNCSKLIPTASVESTLAKRLSFASTYAESFHWTSQDIPGSFECPEYISEGAEALVDPLDLNSYIPQFNSDLNLVAPDSFFYYSSGGFPDEDLTFQGEDTLVSENCSLDETTLDSTNARSAENILDITDDGSGKLWVCDDSLIGVNNKKMKDQTPKFFICEAFKTSLASLDDEESCLNVTMELEEYLLSRKQKMFPDFNSFGNDNREKPLDFNSFNSQHFSENESATPLNSPELPCRTPSNQTQLSNTMSEEGKTARRRSKLDLAKEICKNILHKKNMDNKYSRRQQQPTIFGTVADDHGPRDNTKRGLPQAPKSGKSLGGLDNGTQDWALAPDDDLSLVYQEGLLVSGSLEALIQHSTPTPIYYPDTAYLFAFLLSARLFIKPHDLLHKICDLGFAQQGLKSNDLNTINKDQLGNFIPHMVQLLGEWSETFPYDFRDERMMVGVRTLTHRCIALQPTLRRDVTQVLHNLLNKLTQLERYEESLTKLTVPPPSDSLELVPDIIEACPSALVMAQQLTHIELERLSYIGPEEFVQAFAKDNLEATYKDLKKTNNLESYVQWFNRLSYLVATQACSPIKKKQRVRVIEYWIEVARESFNIGNFNSLMGIIAGLNMSPVSRLKKTWNKVQSAKFSVLEHQMDPSSNFSSYRSTLKAAMWRSAGAVDERQKIVIPFFSLLVKDLYFLNEGCANRLPNTHINFDKFWQLAKQVTEFMAWKQVTCPFEKCVDVLTYLQSTPVLTETGLALASFEGEGPDNSYEKERYKTLKSNVQNQQQHQA